MTLSNFFTLMFASATSATVLLSGAPAPNRIVAVFETAAAQAACTSASSCAPTGTQGPLKEVPSSTTKLSQEQLNQQAQESNNTNNTSVGASAGASSGSNSGATGIGVGGNATLQNGINVDASNRSNTQVDSRNFAGTGVIFQPGQSVVVNARTSYLICLPSGKVHVQTVEASPLAITFQSKSLGINASLFGSLGFGFNNSKVALDQQGTAVSRLLQSQFVFDGLNSDRASSNNELTSFAFGIRAQRAQFSSEEISKGQLIIAKLRSAAVELDCKPTVSIPTTPVVYLGTPDVPTTKKKKPSVPSVPSIPILY